MAAFATTGQVAARWRALTAAELSLIAVLLDDASDMIRVRWPDIDDRIVAETVSADTLVRIVSGMVRRAVMNRATEGVGQTSVTAGPFSQQMTLTNTDGNLYLTAQDIADLTDSTHRARMGWLA